MMYAYNMSRHLDRSKFTSKAATGREISSWLRDKEPGETIDHPGDLELLNRVFLMHPEADRKLSKGVARVEIGLDASGRSRCILLHYRDGSSDDISYRKCLFGGSKSAVARQRVVAALRAAISDQVREFRRDAFSRGPVTCEVTGRTLSDSVRTHVDHDFSRPGKTFAELCQRFAEERGVVLESFPNRDAPPGEFGRCLSDPDDLRAWQDFHRREAVLRLVDADANMKGPIAQMEGT